MRTAWRIRSSLTGRTEDPKALLRRISRWLPTLALDEPPHEVQRAIAEGLATQYDDWRVIADAELARGEELGKERERMGWDEAKALIRRVS